MNQTHFEAVLTKRHGSVCPWWLAWTLVNPLRRWLDKPEALLGDFVRAGDRVLEIGPGYGFYSEPMARSVGPSGKVVCVDVQQRMLDGMQRRLARRGLGERIEARCCTSAGAWLDGLQGTCDKAVLIYVLHEIPDPRRTLAEAYAALKPGGLLLLVEPRQHCSSALWAAELWAAEQVGFVDAQSERWGSLATRQAALFRRSKT